MKKLLLTVVIFLVFPLQAFAAVSWEEVFEQRIKGCGELRPSDFYEDPVTCGENLGWLIHIDAARSRPVVERLFNGNVFTRSVAVIGIGFAREKSMINLLDEALLDHRVSRWEYNTRTLVSDFAVRALALVMPKEWGYHVWPECKEEKGNFRGSDCEWATSLDEPACRGSGVGWVSSCTGYRRQRALLNNLELTHIQAALREPEWGLDLPPAKAVAPNEWILKIRKVADNWGTGVPYGAWQEIEDAILSGKEPPDEHEAITRHRVFEEKTLKERGYEITKTFDDLPKENTLQNMPVPPPTPKDDAVPIWVYLLPIPALLAAAALVILLRRKRK